MKYFELFLFHEANLPEPDEFHDFDFWNIPEVKVTAVNPY